MIAHYILFNLSVYLGWMLYFNLLQRPFFLLYNRRSAPEGVTAADLRSIFTHAFRTDIVSASYLSAIPLLASTAQLFIAGEFLREFMTVYIVVISIAMGLIVVADTLLYKFWEFKLEASVLHFLRSLKGTCASVSSLYILAVLGLWAVWSALSGVWLLAVLKLALHA
ncbi:MAG: hypothetical protein K2K72_05360, partial [Duncaniella sp.]|nr:hypothetical protein [Duncaniella sp.]